MNEKRYDLSALATLAHRALNEGDSEYAWNKALISQFFSPSCAVEQKEAVRLTLIDSLYSTNVSARRLFGISDIAKNLRRVFPDDDSLKKCAAQWIDSGFAAENPLYAVFAERYGIDTSGESTKGAYSLLSKYLYFATGYAFPIYDALGAKHHYIAGKKSRSHFQKRFCTLREIMRENAIDDFDKLDNFFWLYGKVSEGSFSLVLNQTRYVNLMKYAGTRPPANIIDEIRTGQTADGLKEIIGASMFAFIQQTNNLDKE
jgi:hypothetical protein